MPHHVLADSSGPRCRAPATALTILAKRRRVLSVGRSRKGGMTDLELRPIDRTEFPDFYRTLAEVFGEPVRDAERERMAGVFEAERSLAVFDAGEMVATAGAYTRDLTVPGGPRPVAGVTVVSVLPTHRRRGLLTEMMRRQLTGLHEAQQEPVAALWAFEGGIYGRFGYGVAARQAAWRVDKERLRLLP